MQSLPDRQALAEAEIAMAIEESHRPHTEAEQVGILLWEMDWRVEREFILAEMAAEQATAQQRLSAGCAATPKGVLDEGVRPSGSSE